MRMYRTKTQSSDALPDCGCDGLQPGGQPDRRGGLGVPMNIGQLNTEEFAVGCMIDREISPTKLEISDLKLDTRCRPTLVLLVSVSRT